MTHIQSLTNATGMNRDRVNTGCFFLLSQMTHIQSLTMLQATTEVELTLAVSFLCHR